MAGRFVNVMFLSLSLNFPLPHSVSVCSRSDPLYILFFLLWNGEMHLLRLTRDYEVDNGDKLIITNNSVVFFQIAYNQNGEGEN